MTKIAKTVWGSKTKLHIPEDYWGMVEDISLLVKDGDNPNRMTKEQHEGTWASLSEFGWVYPLITDKEGTFSDGEQRQYIALRHNEKYAPVLRIPLDDPRRRQLRQVLNKLKGEHDPKLDALEFKRLMDAGLDDELRTMLAITEDEFDKTLQLLDEPPFTPGPGEDETDEDEEESGLVECPKCNHQFNPEHFKAKGIKIEDESEDMEAHIREGKDRGLEKEHTVILDIVYKTEPTEVTERSISVAEAFGIGIDESIKFPVYTSFEISYDPTDLIYITGDSGSGKTTFLNLIGDHEAERGRKVISFEKTRVKNDETVIDGLGGNADEAMNLLSAAGLSEAFLMLRKYSELSDGQKYRYQLAKMLSRDADVYLIDRIGENLDRVMAKVLAYNIQKWARRKNRMIVAASTHHDIITDFNPNTLVYKGFAEEAQIRYRSAIPRDFSLLKKMNITEGTLEDFKQLERFHYLGAKKLIAINIFKLTYDDNLIGVVLYQSPHITLRARNQVLPRYKGSIKYKSVTDSINKDIIRLSRIIIHPKFRGVGLAVKLVKETMPKTGKKVVEVLAAMAKYNPFLEKAGMKKHGIVGLNDSQKKVHKTIEKLGGIPAMMNSPTHRKDFIESLTEKQANALTDALTTNLKSLLGQGYSGRHEGIRIIRDVASGGLEALLGDLIPTERVYLYWENPDL